MKLDEYVGRIVRLRKHAFKDVARFDLERGVSVQNRFLVAKVSAGKRELICYGENLRVTISARDVVLV